jgi:hypothetical protein
VCQALRPLYLDAKVQRRGILVPGNLVKQLHRMSVADALTVLRT